MGKKATYLHEDLTDWFVRNCKSTLVNRFGIAAKIAHLRGLHKLPSIDIIDRVIDQNLTLVRKDLIARYSLMLYRVNGSMGRSLYKIATPDEMAIATTKVVRKAIIYTDNAVQHVEVIKERGCIDLLRAELRKELMQSTGRMKLVSKDGKSLLKVIAEVSRNGGMLTKKSKELTYEKK